MASKPNSSSTVLRISLAVLLPLLLLTEAVWGNVNSYGDSPPDTTDNIQSRIIPPFSPSLELARSMGSSPVTPQGNDGDPLGLPMEDSLDDRYGSYLGERRQQLEQQLEPPEGIDEGVARGVAIPDAAYPRDLISEKGPRWRKDEVNPLIELGLAEENDMEDEDEDDCPPRLAEGFITWRRNNRVVRATLPHMVPSSCTPPLRCSVSTTVHRRVFLQDGDTLEVILQAPPDYTPPTNPPTSTFNPSPQSPTPSEAVTGLYPDEEITDQPTIAPTPSQTSQQQLQDSQLQQSDSVDKDQSPERKELFDEQDQQEEIQGQSHQTQKQTEDQRMQKQNPKENPDHLQDEEMISGTGKQSTQPEEAEVSSLGMSTHVPQEENSSKDTKEEDQNLPQKVTVTDYPPLATSVHPTQQVETTQRPTKDRPQNSPKPAAHGEATSAHINKTTHLFSRDDHHIVSAHSSPEPPTSLRRKRETEEGDEEGFPHVPPAHPKRPAVLDRVGDMAKKKKEIEERINLMMMKQQEEEKEQEEEEEEREKQMATSPLTIWRVSVSEWSSCSTREGGQVGETSPNGIVTISPRSLQVGTNYFIGRSSWSSTECFQLQVTVRSAECGEGSLCSGKGTCYANATMEHFQCKCCKAYMGTHCEEINACVSSPCLNLGICVDIQEGHASDTFQCLCRYGYRGRFCEEQTNLCESSPCHNGATCTGNHSTYTCHCPHQWTGQQCTDPVETTELMGHLGRGSDGRLGCTANPCNNGICIETPTQEVRCFCHPGFGGQRCEFEYNECESSPCENGGTCVDHVGKYQCICGRGYTGERCQIKFDLCSPDPCGENRICVDKGNSHSCECLNGLTEDNCGPHIQVCTPNPCDNGGTCWIVPQARVFYCSCRAGFTGITCQGITLDSHDEAVPETVSGVETVDPGALDVHLPMNHMRNIYVAFATLASALLIFALVVGACHCRVNRTYRKCFVKFPRPSKVLPSVRRPRPTSLFDKSSQGD